MTEGGRRKGRGRKGGRRIERVEEKRKKGNPRKREEREKNFQRFKRDDFYHLATWFPFINYTGTGLTSSTSLTHAGRIMVLCEGNKAQLPLLRPPAENGFAITKVG